MSPLGGRPPFGSALHGAFSGTRSGEERIREEDFESVLTVLAGPSPWQQYIRANLRITRQHLPRRPFRVVKYAELAETMRALGDEQNIGHIPGVTDKRTGTIIMQEWFGVNSNATFLGAALHETVHLVSHPANQGRAHSTGFSILGEGLLEGMVECVTLDILKAQRITLAREKWRGHIQRVPVAVALLRSLSVSLLARVLFGGDFQQFVLTMHHIYSRQGWEEIKQLTTENKPQQAIRRMSELRASQEQQRATQLRINVR
jgi:hypothetical protein